MLFNAVPIQFVQFVSAVIIILSMVTRHLLDGKRIIIVNCCMCLFMFDQGWEFLFGRECALSTNSLEKGDKKKIKCKVLSGILAMSVDIGRSINLLCVCEGLARVENVTYCLRVQNGLELSSCIRLNHCEMLTLRTAGIVTCQWNEESTLLRTRSRSKRST